jgi:heme/copper-type cytochrome/quinol oxidase subunit 2
MKSFKVIFVVLALMALVPLAANADSMKAYKQMVEKMDAVQAMAFANQWKWTQSSIKTSVTPKEVVFEFPDKTIKKVALPADKMVVAIAPYLTYTHG